jgi:hypothetical protein
MKETKSADDGERGKPVLAKGGWNKQLLCLKNFFKLSNLDRLGRIWVEEEEE